MSNSIGGPIDKIIGKYATPEIKKALKESAKKAEGAAEAKSAQTSNIARSEVKYKAGSLVDVVKEAATEYLSKTMKRPLTPGEVNLLERSGLYQLIAKEAIPGKKKA